MKIIKINESQKNRLFEAYREGFSFDTLSVLGGDAFSDWRDWEKQYEYCVKWLGEPDGFGSSRCVFTLSDNVILKLAMGGYRNAGVEQNRLEYEMYNRYKSPLLARVYDADENFTYIVCENVVPAEDIDFEKILGIPIGNVWHQNSSKYKEPYGKGDTTVGFNKYFHDIKKPYQEYEGITLYDVFCYLESNYVVNDDDSSDSEEIEEVIDNSEWLSALRDLVEETRMSDFCNVENYGMVNRDGKPTLVILDAGMNLDLWEKHYAD